MMSEVDELFDAACWFCDRIATFSTPEGTHFCKWHVLLYYLGHHYLGLA